ncbi:MAG: polyhydroxyalkanoate synthesis repressor PhaR, partial [Pseudomonadota bacterium]
KLCRLSPSYLEMSMDAFSKNQEEMRSRMRDAFGGAPGFNMFEDSVRKNMELYEQAMKMFSPLGPAYAPAGAAAAPQQAESGSKAGGGDDADINALKSQVAALQRKLDKLENEGE